MRVTFGSSFGEGMRGIARAAEALQEAQRQISTGRRISRLSDDPLGAAAAIGERASLARLDAFKSASDAAAYRLGLADSVLSDVVTQLTAAQTTALAARGSSKTQGERDAAANELLAIRDALMGDINTKFQGEYLFSGSMVNVAPFTASGGGISAYQGDANATSIEIGSGRLVDNTFDGGKLLQGSDPQHVLDALTDLAAAISAGDQAGIDAGVQAVNHAFDRATAAQAGVGNDLRLLDDTQALASANRLASLTRLSAIEDVDLASAAAGLAQADTAYRAALAAVSTIGRLSLMDYLK